MVFCLIYTFNIDPIQGNPALTVTDERIGFTIASIFKQFFITIENVVVYICDSLDNRQLARKRKFDLWFSSYNDGSLIKKDGFVNIDNIEIFNSLILHIRNPQLVEIVLAFNELNNTAADK